MWRLADSVVLEAIIQPDFSGSDLALHSIGGTGMEGDERRECPNCGAEMQLHRREHQHVRRGLVLLAWLICLECRHVMLEHWSVVPVPAPV